MSTVCFVVFVVTYASTRLGLVTYFANNLLVKLIHPAV